MSERAIEMIGPVGSLLGQAIEADYRIVAVTLGLLLIIVVVYLLTKRSA